MGGCVTCMPGIHEIVSVYGFHFRKLRAYIYPYRGSRWVTLGNCFIEFVQAEGTLRCEVYSQVEM